MWWAFYNENERRVGPGGDLEEVRGFVGKLPEMAARLAAVLAAFEQGTAFTAIDAVQLARGVALAEFYLAEALRLFGIGPVNQGLASAQALSNWLRDKWDENLICATTIKQFGPSMFKKMSADDLTGVIDTLVRHEHLSPQLPNGGEVRGHKRRRVWRIQVQRG